VFASVELRRACIMWLLKRATARDERRATGPDGVSSLNPGSPLCPIGGWLPEAVHSSKANQSSPVLEPHRIPLEHRGATLPILVRVISLEQSVQEPLLFGAPSFHFTLRRRPTPLPPAPFDASDERGDGLCLTWTVKGVTILTSQT